MKAVSWRKWMKNPTEKHQLEPYNERHLVWLDAVTETIFSIEKDEYIRLRNLLQEKLSDLNADQCFKLLSGKDIPFGNVDELKLATQLPYFETTDRPTIQKRTRISDHILIRTGIFYAINHPDSNEWNSLRKQLLQLNCSLAKDIDSYLETGKWTGDDVEIDIIKAGAVKIKKYLMETNGIQEIRGASLLLDNLNRSRIVKLCENNWTPESLIYSGGGNILLILPKGLGWSCQQLIEEMFKTITVSCQAIAEAQTVSMSDLTNETINNTLSWLEMKKNDRQMSLYPYEQHPEKTDLNYLYSSYDSERFEQTVQHESLTKQDMHQLDSFLSVEIDNKQLALCEICKIRVSTTKVKNYKGKHPFMCKTCLHKIRSGRNRNRFIEEMKEVLSNQHIVFTPDKFSDDIGDLIEGTNNKYIAVINGDGNNMGAIVEQISSFQVYRYFSQLTDYLTKFTVYLSISEIVKEVHSSRKANFEIIGLGGDDVFIIVPGTYALDLAKEFGRKFDRAFFKYGEDQSVKNSREISLSVGVCIADPKIPFTTLFNISDELIKSAKKMKKQNENIKGGTIDYIKLKTSTPFSSGLENYRNLYLKQHINVHGKETLLKKYFRPLTWDQLENLSNWMETMKLEIKTARSIIYQLREMVDQMSYYEAKLYFHYFIDSKNINDRTNLKKMLYSNPLTNQNAALKLDELFITGQEEKEETSQEVIYSIWHDMVELWDVKVGEQL